MGPSDNLLVETSKLPSEQTPNEQPSDNTQPRPMTVLPDEASKPLVTDVDKSKIHPFFRVDHVKDGKPKSTAAEDTSTKPTKPTKPAKPTETNKTLPKSTIDVRGVEEEKPRKHRSRPPKESKPSVEGFEQRKLPRKPRSRAKKITDKEGIIVISSEPVLYHDEALPSSSAGLNAQLPSPTSLKDHERPSYDLMDIDTPRSKRRKISQEATPVPELESVSTPTSSDLDLQSIKLVEPPSSPPKPARIPAILVAASSPLPVPIPYVWKALEIVDSPSSNVVIPGSETFPAAPVEVVVAPPVLLPLAPLFKKSKRRSKSPAEPQSTPPKRELEAPDELQTPAPPPLAPLFTKQRSKSPDATVISSKRDIKPGRKSRSAKTAAKDSIKQQLLLNPSPTTVRFLSEGMLEKAPVPALLLKAPKAAHPEKVRGPQKLILKLKIGREKLQDFINAREIQKASIPAPIKPRAPNLSKKTTHPFFVKGAVKPIPFPDTVDSDLSENLEGSEAKASTRNTAESNNSFLKFALSGPSSTSSLSGAGTKFQQLMDPLWPPPGTSHVHGFDEDDSYHIDKSRVNPARPKRELKQKGKFILSNVEEAESIINRLSIQLNRGRETEDIDTLEIPPSVRIPERQELAACAIVKEHLRVVIKSRLSSSTLHPALKVLRDRIYDGEKLLAPVDKAECETQAWVVKYAPKIATEVLQIGKEPLLLKEWLQRMKVWAVGKTHKKKPKKLQVKKPKKKKRPEGLDDFLISEDEEDDLMDEITDPEDEVMVFPGTSLPSSNLKSVIRHGELKALSKDIDNDSSDMDSELEGKKCVNAIVISGPCGVGKTAAVYAAAAEQGFTVFEINAGFRRGGKEIMDLVGEMSKNHLVHQAKASEAKAPTNSFFKLKTGTSAQLTPIAPANQNLQQSLILIEEADLLYEEDKGFWPTVLALIAQSKRPVVITCNDESLLQMENLSLHAILRFGRPPKDLVVDYLELLTSAEGHLLARSTIESLYDDCRGDLRKAIMQLDFWCQMAIGDRTGGTKWWVKRFPIGCDVDEDGEVLRLCSKETYHIGMGTFGRDLSYERENLDPHCCLPEQDDIWRDIYESSGVDIGERLFESLSEELGASVPGFTSGNLENVRELDHYARYMDSLSAADVYAGNDFRNGSFVEDSGCLDTILDPTAPPVPLKQIPDNILGRSNALGKQPILHVSPVIHNLSTSRSMGIYVRSASCNLLYKSLQHKESSAPANDQNSEDFASTSMDELAGYVADKNTRLRPGAPISQARLRQPFTLSAQGSTSLPNMPVIVHSQLLRPTSVLTTEVTPYVRAIARIDLQLEEERAATSNLLSAGGGKKARTTRAAVLAATGRARGTGRAGEKHLRGNAKDMVNTAGKGWANALQVLMQAEYDAITGSSSETGSPRSSVETDAPSDVAMTDGFVENGS